MEKFRLALEAKLEAANQARADEMEKFRLSIDAKIQAAKFDLVKWIFPAFVAQGAFIVTLVKLL